MSLKKASQRILRKLGYDVLSVAYSQEYVYDRYLVSVLRRFGIQSVLDIGANVGGYGQMLRDIGYRGAIHSFEPCIAPYNALTQLAKSDANWTTHRLGFSDQAGSAMINLMAGSELNSVLTPRESSERMSIQGTEEILLETIDKLDLSIDWQTAFVKIDTQGHDLAVMRGGRYRLQQVPLLQTEISYLPIYQDMPTHRDTYNALDEIGFDVIGMFPISRDTLGRIREFDCLCVNRRLAKDLIRNK